ncbi:MAG: FlgD immunoglobulin-like domain containing protein [bacterium]
MNKILFWGIALILLMSITTSYAAILVTNQNATFSSPTTTIDFRLNVGGTVTVYIKEAVGNTTIKTISAGTRSAGANSVVWDGSKNGGGVATTGQYYAVIDAVGAAVATYTPILSSPIAYGATDGVGVAFNKNAMDAVRFGRMYTTDKGLKLISMYYPDGTFIRSTSGYAVGSTFSWQPWGGSAPYSIDIDSKGVIYVTDRSKYSVRQFDPDMNYLQTLGQYLGTYARMDGSVTGDTTNGAVYELNNSQVRKWKVVSGVFDATQSNIITYGSGTDLRSVLAAPDNSLIYCGFTTGTPGLGMMQLTSSDTTYIINASWNPSIDSVFAMDFSLDTQYLWLATLDTTINVKKLRISDAQVVDSFQAGIGRAGCLALDPAGNIAVFYGNQLDIQGVANLNIWQPPDSGSSWQSQSNNFTFTAPLNLAPSIDSSAANPATIPANGTTSSQLTVYISDATGYTDDTAVLINLTQIGGSALQAMDFVSGGGNSAIYQTTVTAALDAKAGNLLLPVYVYDSGGNFSSGNVSLTVTAGAISGIVTISGSTIGIEGATVTAIGGTGPYTATSDSTGAYIISAGIGTYTVTASKTGWNVGINQSDIPVVFANTTQNVNVTLTPKSVIETKSLSLPATVAVSGVVIVPRGANPSPPWGLNNQYFIADIGGSEGLRINDSGSGKYPHMGDVVVVEGLVVAPNNELAEIRINNPPFYAVIGTGALGTPQLMTCANINTTNFDKFVTLSEATVIAVNVVSDTSSFTVQDGTGTAMVLYDTNPTVSDTVLPIPGVGTTITVTGIIEQQTPYQYTPVAVLKPWYMVQVGVTPSLVHLVPTQTQTFTASGGTGPYTWTSSDDAVGTIDSYGVFTAIGNGNCTVKATDTNGYYGYAAVIVQATKAPLATDQIRVIYHREVFGELFE